MRIFGPDIDEALARTRGERRNRHAFDEREGITLHDHAISEGAAVALIRIADDVFAIRLRTRNRAPLDAGGESRASASAQAGGNDLLDHRL